MKAHTRRNKKDAPTLERCCRCDSVLFDGEWQDFTRIYVPIIDLSFKASLCKNCRVTRSQSATMSRVPAQCG